MEFKTRLWVWIGLVVLIGAGSIGRWYAAYHLYNPALNTQRLFSGDEVVYIALGDRIWKEGRYDAQGVVDRLPIDRTRVRVPEYLDAPLFKHPPLVPLMVGLSRKLFWGVYGCSIYPSLLMGAVGLAGMFWLARELGLSPSLSLLAVLLLVLSPVHWISSSRIWLDSTLVAFILLACAAHLRALSRPGWYVAMGLFWGLALLTKYTAFAGWAFMAAADLIRPETRKNKMFWVGQGILLVLFLPWLGLRWWVEGTDVIFFWRSGVEDWRSASRLAAWWWLLPAAAGAGWMWLRISRRGTFAAWSGRPATLIVGTLVFMGIAAPSAGMFDFGELPWFGWGPNDLRNSARSFYLLYPVLFEPVLWWGLIGLVLHGQGAKWNLLRAGWLGFFLFLTVWGNFQSRYGLPLLPFEQLFAVGLLGSQLASSRVSVAMKALVATWLVLSWIRSIWIMEAVGIENRFFYF